MMPILHISHIAKPIPTMVHAPTQFKTHHFRVIPCYAALCSVCYRYVGLVDVPGVVTSPGGPIAQSVEQWSRNSVTRVRNQGDALVPFRKVLILITRSLGEDLKPSAVWLLTYKHLCFLSSQVK